MFNEGTNGGYSLADIAAATGEGKGGLFGGDGGAWLIIILFIFCFMGMGGNGFLGLGGSAGATESYNVTSDLSNIDRKLDGITAGLNTNLFEQTQLATGTNNLINTTSQGILAQMNTNAINSMQDTFALQSGINNNLNSITAQLSQYEANRQAGQCATNNLLTSAVAELNYNMATDDCEIKQVVVDNTRAIIDNANANTKSIMDFLVQDKLATLTAENQALKFAASQQEQNAYLIGALGEKPPVAAYQVPNPYTGQYGYGYGTCTCGM